MVRTDNSKQELPLWEFDWPMVVYFSSIHIIGFVGIWYIPVLKLPTLFLISQTLFWSQISVTAGFHRLWSHRSYKAHWVLRAFLAFGCSLAAQGTIHSWVMNHRVHHKYSDTDADPHNVIVRN